MKLKKFNMLNENSNNPISTSDVWVIYKNGDTEIYEIFLNKMDAENELKRKIDEMNNNRSKYSYHITDDFFNRHMINFEIITLYDTIEKIADYYRDRID